MDRRLFGSGRLFLNSEVCGWRRSLMEGDFVFGPSIHSESLMCSPNHSCPTAQTRALSPIHTSHHSFRPFLSKSFIYPHAITHLLALPHPYEHIPKQPESFLIHTLFSTSAHTHIHFVYTKTIFCLARE